VGYEPTSHYAVYRYKNIVDDPGTDAAHVVRVAMSGDGNGYCVY
jgi:hypothetical protein